MVVTDIVRSSEAGVCPVGYEILKIPNPGNTAPYAARACLKFEPASQATRFITDIRWGALENNYGIRPERDSRCRSWEKRIPLHDRIGPVFPVVQEILDISICYFEYDRNGEPWKAINRIHLPTEAQGCNAGERFIHRFSTYRSPTSTIICAAYADTTGSNGPFVTEVATPGQDQSCPLGMDFVGDMFNRDVPNLRFPFCARTGPKGPDLFGHLAASGVIHNGANPSQPMPCGGLDRAFGVVPVYGGGFGDTFRGLITFCRDTRK